MGKMIVRVLVMCVFLLPAVAHADPIVYDFTITQIKSYVDLNDPSTFTYRSGTFSLTQGQTPDFVGIDNNPPAPPFFEGMGYYNTPYTMTETLNGVVLSQLSGVGTAEFVWDGVIVPNGFHVYNSPLPFDRNDPNHPVFVAGHYWNAVDPFIWYDVVAETPEPSTLALLGTGMLGAFGMMRRRVANLDQ
jgi:hypothetical protein